MRNDESAVALHFPRNGKISGFVHRQTVASTAGQTAKATASANAAIQLPRERVRGAGVSRHHERVLKRNMRKMSQPSARSSKPNPAPTVYRQGANTTSDRKCAPLPMRCTAVSTKSPTDINEASGRCAQRAAPRTTMRHCQAH